MHAPSIKPLLQRRPDAWNAAQWHHLHELSRAGRRNQQHAVRLGIGRGHFGHQFVAGDAHRTRHVEALGHLSANPRADCARPPPLQQCGGHIHIALVHRNLLEPVGDGQKHLMHDSVRHHAVIRHIHWQKNAVRAQPMGARGRHRRIDAVFPGFVARGGHHRARPGADDYRLAFEPGVARHLQ